MAEKDHRGNRHKSRSLRNGIQWFHIFGFLLLALVLPGLALYLFFTLPAVDVQTTQAEVKAAIAAQMYQILFLLVVLGGSIGSVAYWLMKKDLYAEAHNAVHTVIEKRIEEVDERIDARTKYTSLLAEAKAYQGLSHAVFRHYDKEFKEYQELLQEGEQETEEGAEPASHASAIRRGVDLSKELARLGLLLFENPALREKREEFPGEKADENTPYYRWHSLLSHFAYHCAIEQIVIHNGRYVGDSSKYEDFCNALGFAGRCLRRSRETPFRRHWYNMEDCAGLCLALSPVTTERERGKDVLRALINGDNYPEDAPAPDDKWRRDRWRLYNEPLGLKVPMP